MGSLVNRLRGKEIMGHPAGLFFLFFAEMWERMSYYGMRALLVLYMVKFLLADPARANEVLGLNALRSILEFGAGPLAAQPFSSKIYGLYTGFVYLTPIFGGILADRIWGKRKSVYIGGAIMALGHFFMAFQNLFVPALFLLILGNGAFKPNISTQVGGLYKEGDPRRDGAFTIFYMGINLGAFFSPILCGTFAKWLCLQMGWTDEGTAWHIGFSLAGVGMLVGLITYHIGRELFPIEDKSTLAPEPQHTSILVKVVGGMLAIMVAYLGFLALPIVVKAIVVVAAIAGVIYAIKQIPDPTDRAKVGAVVFVSALTVFFWAIFEQQGNTLQLWADEKADWARFGLDAEIYQSFNPAFIFLFAPLLDIWWNYKSKRGIKSSSIRKMGLGCIIAGCGYLVVPLASNYITVDKSLINMFWLGLTTWMFTIGELYLSPIGLSLVTKVAPARFMSMLMGVFLASSFLGNSLAGELGSLYSSMSQTNFFLLFAILGITVGLVFFIAEGKLKRTIGSEV